MNSTLRTATLALLAAGITLTFPAVATAEQKEWDIGGYDQCIGSFDGNPLDSPAEHQRWADHMKMCCEKTGGIFNYAGAGGCVAPPAEQANSASTRWPGRVPVGVFEPARPTTTHVVDGVEVHPLTEAP